MKINKCNALRFWEECYGSKQYAEDFHGNLMCKDGYGNNNFSVNYYGQEIYCGWNIHHILPSACGGTNAKSNLLCTNIATNIHHFTAVFGKHVNHIIQIVHSSFVQIEFNDFFYDFFHCKISFHRASRSLRCRAKCLL